MLLLDRARTVRYRARAPLGSAETILTLVKRGAARSEKPSLAGPWARLRDFGRQLRARLSNAGRSPQSAR